MGLRSGDWGGHSITSMLLSENHWSACLEVCLGSLSCWKILSPSVISISSKLSSSACSKISQYSSSPQLPQVSPHPHTIRLLPPPCLTVGEVVLSEIDSLPLGFQVYTLPSDPILLIFVSSDQSTLFQSSTVQFACVWANLRCFWWWTALSRGCFDFTIERKLFPLSAFLTVWGQTGEVMTLLI